MVWEIRNCKELIPYLKEKIEDEGIAVGIDEEVSPDKLAIINSKIRFRISFRNGLEEFFWRTSINTGI